MPDLESGHPDAEKRKLLALLRGPFPNEDIDKLPKGILKGPDGKPKPKAKCNVCGGYHEPVAVHLDYVGHAAVTARLLDVDPAWNWEPLAFTETGLPAVSAGKDGQPGGLWIKLTILGVTRLGYGSVDPGKADPIKELIGDAIRNAAMRFGVALDLWKKHDAAAVKPAGQQRAQQTREPAPEATEGPQTAPQGDQGSRRHEPSPAAHGRVLLALGQALGLTVDQIAERAGVPNIAEIEPQKAKEIADTMRKELEGRAKQTVEANKAGAA